MRLARGGFVSLATTALLGALLPGRAFGITFSVFTDPHPIVTGGPVSIAYARNKFIGSVDVDGTRALYSVDLDGGNVALFAPNISLAPSPAREHYLAASLGLAGFPAGDIYVGEGSGVRHITNDGLHNDPFVRNLASSVRGIVFDDVGTFGNEMLVTTDGGQVYRVNSAGQATLLASMGEDTAALDIAPLGANFGGLDGQLFVGSEGSGAIRAVRWDGVVTVLPIVVPDGLEALAFVPLELGVSGNPLEGFYGPQYPETVLKAAPSEFAGIHGQLIATSEYDETPITLIHWDGSQFVASDFGQFPPHPEDALFVTEPAVVNRPPDCTSVRAQMLLADPPAHQMEKVTLVGGTDPDGDAVTIEITGIEQDEPTSSAEAEDRCPDAILDGGEVAHVRWERSNGGDGRTYRISYILRDSHGVGCPGSVLVCVPLTRGMPSVCALDGPAYNALGECGANATGDNPVPTVLALRSGAALPGRQQLEYDLPAAGPLTIQAFDVRGRLVRLVEEAERTAGRHVVDWNTNGLPRGVYYVRLETHGEVVMQSVRVLR